MPLCASLHTHNLQFNFEARTSRGPMKNRPVWFLKLWNESNPETFGLGECAPLIGLSKETNEEVEQNLFELVSNINSTSIELPSKPFGSLLELTEYLKINSILPSQSSLVFAIETALLDLANGGKRLIFATQFISGEPISINGLIWMGGLDYLLQQIDIKIRDGFTCIKIKVGGHDFEKECDILQYIRRKYYKQNIVVRVDANGAFKVDDALYKLNILAKFNIHSIEQPIKPGLEEMAMLCRESPVPIALDEELIGIPSEKKESLLARLKPQHIILKPSLMGGVNSCDEWIQLADRLKIGWWATSALESNIGLNAIAQFCSQYPLSIPHGLGTGLLYTNNFDSPLRVNKGQLNYNQLTEWDLTQLFPPHEPIQSEIN